jgi:hypothetical protein
MAELTERDAGDLRGRAGEPMAAGRDGAGAGEPMVAVAVATARREELAQRPEHLRAAAATLHAALAVRADDERDRRERLASALTEAHLRVAAHNEEAEGPVGLLSQVMHDAAWLAPRVHAVAQEHDRLLADCERLCTTGQTGESLTELERTVRTMAARIEEHRHHGTELLMDAYGLDVSAGD